jgi:hypothetical protein
MQPMANQLKMYSIQDQKAQLFHPPYFTQTYGEAERIFTTIVNDPNNQISQYPEDFNLYHLGTYNDETGKMSSLDTPEHCLKAVQVKKSAQPPIPI